MIYSMIISVNERIGTWQMRWSRNDYRDNGSIGSKGESSADVKALSHTIDGLLPILVPVGL
jgi:hypothetical protein